MLVIHTGGVDEGDLFLGEAWPAVAAIADPDLTLHRHFGIRDGKPLELVGPAVFACGIRAASKGVMQGRTGRHTRTIPGVWLFQEGRPIREHRYRHAGDHPNWSSFAAPVPANS